MFRFKVPEFPELILYFCRVGKIYEIYRKNIYGVIGTLVFHILLFAAFLLADVDIKGELPEEEILIELPELMMEPEVPEEEQEIAEQQESEPVPNEASAPQAESQSQRSNIASNRLAQNDKFFDEDYLQELEEAQKLVSDVNNLSLIHI